MIGRGQPALLSFRRCMSTDLFKASPVQTESSRTCFSLPVSTKSLTLPSLGRWYWPTSDSKGRQAEEALFRHAGLPFDDPQRFKQYRLTLGDGLDPLRFINTIVVDQGGLDAPNSDRTCVVLVNGLGAALGVFFQNIQPISIMVPNCRLYCIDWLGMGRSGRPAFPSDPETAQPVDGIKFFLDSFEDWRSKQTGLDRFILIGHSLGGYLSAIYSLWYPEHVIKLILASPAGLPPDHNSPEVEEAMGGVVAVNGQVVPAWIRWLWARNITPQCVVRWLGPVGPSLIRQYIRRRLPTMKQTDIPTFAEYMYHMTADVGSGEFALGTLMRPGAWAKEPLHDQLKDLKMPVTFLYGADDWMDFRHAEDAAKQMTVPVKIIRIPDCGHQLYLEQPDAFNRSVAEECSLSDEVVVL